MNHCVLHINLCNIMVSIIIPCYNAEKYIQQCVDVLLSQTYRNWEAIFVNDGSVDNTELLIKKNLKKDTRIKLFSQQNGGVAQAREYGVSESKGDFITFLDVDDSLNTDSLELLLEKQQDTNADIVVSGFNIIEGEKIEKGNMILFNDLDALQYLRRVLTGKCGWELCGKLYRGDLFRNIHSPKGLRIGEDAVVFIQLVLNAKKISVLRNPVYNYIRNQNSASKIRNKEYAEECLKAPFFINDILKCKSNYMYLKNEIDSMFLLFYCTSIKRYHLNRRNEMVNNIWKEHANFKAFLKLPLFKSIYIILNYFL